MNIFYFGDSWSGSTSLHRTQALRRLGHEVTLADPGLAAGKAVSNRFFYYFHQSLGFRLLQSSMLRWLKSLNIAGHAPDVIWVNGGEFFGPRCLLWLRQLGVPIVLYNNDDPTGTRDGHRFDSLRQAIRHYDLCAVLRDLNIPEYQALGAQKVIRVMMSYDEVTHAPFANAADIPEQFRSDVGFVGTWMRHENRDLFLLKLIEAGFTVAIWGQRWEKSPHWERLQPFRRGKHIGGRDYVAALQGAKICLGLISKGNRDLYTRRSVEVPYAGGLLCGERTITHESLYREGEEAVFWSTAEECVGKCKELLANDERRAAIRAAGRRRVLELKVGNEDVCRQILAGLESKQAVAAGKFR